MDIKKFKLISYDVKFNTGLIGDHMLGNCIMKVKINLLSNYKYLAFLQEKIKKGLEEELENKIQIEFVTILNIR